jgi:tRNA pseudouridine65 synthase
MTHLKILHKHRDFFAIDKPAGFVVHAPAGSLRKSHSLWNVSLLLPEQTGERAFTPHRLDRATSGILLVARNQEAARGLSALFKDQDINKTYFCLVRGHTPDSFSIDRPLSLGPTQESQEALTELTTVFRWDESLIDGSTRTISLVECAPKTGRYHQIRRHLSGAGFPLLGDRTHGDKKFHRLLRSIWTQQLWLRAAKLRFRWGEQEVEIVAPWRSSWHKAFDRIGLCPWMGPLTPTHSNDASPTERATDLIHDELESLLARAAQRSDS